MGYTHYWTQVRDLKGDEWAQITADIGELLKHLQHEQGIVLANGSGDAGTQPEFDRDDIMFNGLGDDSHETMIIRRKRRRPHYEGDRIGWEFCKTARKPYDLAVTACLSYLATITRKSDPASGEPIIGSEQFLVSSDGDGGDWVAGVEAARKALPRYANQLDIPMPIMQSDRWCAPWISVKDTCKEFDANFCVDGHAYVLRPKTGESYRFATHLEFARWLEKSKRVVFASGGNTRFGSYDRVEDDIWRASGSFDARRHARIGKGQANKLATLFPVDAEHAHQPPAFVRPGDLPENGGREFCYDVASLMTLCERGKAA